MKALKTLALAILAAAAATATDILIREVSKRRNHKTE
jgi:hypothetical protein